MIKIDTQEINGFVEDSARTLAQRMIDETHWNLQNMQITIKMYFKNIIIEYLKRKNQEDLEKNDREKINGEMTTKRARFFIQEIGRAKNEESKINVLLNALREQKKMRFTYNQLESFIIEKYGEEALKEFYEQYNKEEEKEAVLPKIN